MDNFFDNGLPNDNYGRYVPGCDYCDTTCNGGCTVTCGNSCSGSCKNFCNALCLPGCGGQCAPLGASVKHIAV